MGRRLAVERGALVVTDGIGDHCRSRLLGKATHSSRRVVVILPRLRSVKLSKIAGATGMSRPCASQVRAGKWRRAQQEAVGRRAVRGNRADHRLLLICRPLMCAITGEKCGGVVCEW